MQADVVLDRAMAESLKRIRWARGLTLEQCAAAIDAQVLAYMAKERGRAPFKPDEFQRLMNLLKIEADDLARWAAACAATSAK